MKDLDSDLGILHLGFILIPSVLSTSQPLASKVSKSDAFVDKSRNTGRINLTKTISYIQSDLDAWNSPIILVSFDLLLWGSVKFK